MSSLLLLPFIGLAAAAPYSYPRQSQNSTLHLNNLASDATTTSNWWYANIDHSSGPVRDFVPDLFSGSTQDFDYPVYIAINSGDAAGFRDALYSNGPNGQRDNGWIAGQPRTVYLAPGTYELSETVFLDTDTVIIGDAVNPPTIKAASGFSGDYMIVAGMGGNEGNGGESHFSVMIKNVILDTTANTGNGDFIALSWRVAQNSALVNVEINMPQGAHTGLWLGQGSTIQAGDISFNFGTNGVWYDGHQQATLKNMHFKDCTTGILIDNGETVNIFAPTFDTCGKAVVLNSGAAWVSVVDGVSIKSGTFFTSNVQFPNFLLENISKDNTDGGMVVVDGNTKIPGSTQNVGRYVYGNTHGADPIYQTNPAIEDLSRPKALAPNTNYPISSADQYTSATVDDVINLKDSAKNGGVTLTGDGDTNDGPALQTALNTAASAGKIAYLPFGIYRTEVTITIPSGTRLVGNGWSTINGYGDAFSDESNPTPIVQVGKPGDVGTADIQDMRFTVGEALPGAIVLQFNMAGNNPGDVAIHNSLITVGGTRDTELRCDTEVNCRAAYIGLHLASTSSAYVDNFWSWVADHESDDSGASGRTAGKGGVLVEATKGTWLAGLGSEHWFLYQLNYNNAENVFSSLFQSETNYHQGTAADIMPPAPFTPTDSDPDFSWCDGDSQCPMSLAQFFQGGSSIYQYAAGSWNFFGGTQATMNYVKTAPTDMHLYGLTDHETHFIMKVPDGSRFGNGGSDGYGGSWGTLVASYVL